MTYKRYTAEIEYSSEDQVYYGKISGITDLVSFEANTEGEIEKAFIEAVEDYIKTCKQVGKEPQKVKGDK